MSKLLVNGHEVPWCQDGYTVEFVCDKPEIIGPILITANNNVTIRSSKTQCGSILVRWDDRYGCGPNDGYAFCLDGDHVYPTGERISLCGIPIIAGRKCDDSAVSIEAGER